MTGKSTKNIQQLLWRKLTGDPGEFSMENRAFNYISVVTFSLLIYYLAFCVYLHQMLIATVMIILVAVQLVLYYFSRYKKKYQAGVIVYAICSYSVLSLNYYVNAGINGPTLCLLFLTLQTLIAIGKPQQYPLWITLHTLLMLLLLYSEYIHPDWVPDSYNTRKERFIDIAGNFIAAFIFMLAIISYLRKYLDRKRILAEQSTKALLDINKQIVAQNKELEKVNQEKNKLFSIISHDLKSPLDSILGYLEILSGNTLDSNERQHIEQQLHDQTKYTSDLLINMLSWSRTQMQGVRVNLAAINVSEIVEAIVSNKKSVAAKKDIKLTYSIDPKIEAIADKDMLHIVIRNLIINAIKFTGSGGEIFIRVIKKDKELVLSVQDTGIGIPKEKLPELFTLKTKSTYGTNNEKGIGLGLMMCKEFIVYQNGKIWLESEAGVGTTFYISLPAALR